MKIVLYQTAKDKSDYYLQLSSEELKQLQSGKSELILPIEFLNMPGTQNGKILVVTSNL